jgi:hypothetical protein
VLHHRRTYLIFDGTDDYMALRSSAMYSLLGSSVN